LDERREQGSEALLLVGGGAQERGVRVAVEELLGGELGVLGGGEDPGSA